MKTNLIAQKRWRNAAAFIEVNTESGEVTVYGKFYTDDGIRRRSYPGPQTPILDVMSGSLLEEVRGLMSTFSKKSDELEKYISKIWKTAQEVEPWFSY